jgi:hypothetical protein
MADDETQVFSKSQLSCIAPANVIVRRNTFNGDLPEIKRLVATVQARQHRHPLAEQAAKPVDPV